MLEVEGNERIALKGKKWNPNIAAQPDRLISVMKCSGRACCYYPSGCYCPKPRTGNEMIYDVLVSRQRVCVVEWVWVDVPFKRGASVRHHLPDGGYNRWWDCGWEKIYLCLPCTLTPSPTLNKHAHMKTCLVAPFEPTLPLWLGRFNTDGKICIKPIYRESLSTFFSQVVRRLACAITSSQEGECDS